MVFQNFGEHGNGGFRCGFQAIGRDGPFVLVKRPFRRRLIPEKSVILENDLNRCDEQTGKGFGRLAC
jgi:hypothetical protein